MLVCCTFPTKTGIYDNHKIIENKSRSCRKLSGSLHVAVT